MNSRPVSHSVSGLINALSSPHDRHQHTAQRHSSRDLWNQCASVCGLATNVDFINFRSPPRARINECSMRKPTAAASGQPYIYTHTHTAEIYVTRGRLAMYYTTGAARTSLSAYRYYICVETDGVNCSFFFLLVILGNFFGQLRG